LEPNLKKHGNGCWHHKGDIGNFTDANGGTINLNYEWNIGSEIQQKTLKGLIVHEGTDFVSQPSGNAGAEVCSNQIMH
jgi:Cu/Zn superoxide dismutase